MGPCATEAVREGLRSWRRTSGIHVSGRESDSRFKGAGVSWTDVARLAVSCASVLGSLVFSCAALAISLVAILQSSQSNATSQQAVDIARNERQTRQEETRRLASVTLQTSYYVASSPHLRDEHDSQWFDPLHLEPKLIQTRYWLTEWAHYNTDSDKWYVFIVVQNRGTGRAKEIQISDTNWIPKQNTQAPDGWADIESSLGPLDPDEFYALLVDTVESYDPTAPWANAHFTEVELTVQCQDVLGHAYDETARMSGLGPVEMWEPYMQGYDEWF